MKRLIALCMLVSVLLLAVASMSSCSAASHGVGKATSVSLLNATQKELEKNGVGQISRLEDAAVAEYQSALEADGAVLSGSMTGVLRVDYENAAGELLTEMLGFDDAEDTESVAQYFEKKYAAEIAEGRARVTRNGYVLTVTVATFVLG